MSEKPWHYLPHRDKEDGWVDILRPDGTVLFTFKAPPNMTKAEFIRALHHVAQVGETERFGPA